MNNLQKSIEYFQSYLETYNRCKPPIEQYEHYSQPQVQAYETALEVLQAIQRWAKEG